MPWIVANDADFTGFPPFEAQIPYWVQARFNPSTGFSNTWTAGYCIGHLLQIGPTFSPAFGAQPSIWGQLGSYTSSLPAQLRGVRLRVGRTGTAPAGNLVVTIWHTFFDLAYTQITNSDDFGLFNFATQTPDASGTYPLSSLPLVSSANNNTTGITSFSQIEIALDTAVVFSADTPRMLPNHRYAGSPDVQFTYWQAFMAVYLDTGFAPASNLVVNTTEHSTNYTSFVADSLNFESGLLGGMTIGNDSPFWWGGPRHDAFTDNGEGMAMALSGVELLLEPIAATTTTRSGSFAQVIG